MLCVNVSVEDVELTWVHGMANQCWVGVEQPILSKGNGVVIEVNFSRALVQIMSEIKYLDAMGFHLPEFALSITLQEDKYALDIEGLLTMVQVKPHILPSLLLWSHPALHSMRAGSRQQQHWNIYTAHPMQTLKCLSGWDCRYTIAHWAWWAPQRPCCWSPNWTCCIMFWTQALPTSPGMLLALPALSTCASLLSMNSAMLSTRCSFLLIIVCACMLPVCIHKYSSIYLSKYVCIFYKIIVENWLGWTFSDFKIFINWELDRMNSQS